MSRLLVLGIAPGDFSPEEGVLAGPWCITRGGPNDDSGCCSAAAGFEEDAGSFVMPPEPFESSEMLELAAGQARQLIVELAPQLAAELNVRHGVAHDARYWDFVLSPWLTRFCEVLVDRLHRSEGILRSFGGMELNVPVQSSGSRFVFADTQDFIMGGILDPQWNHWLLDRLLQRRWPSGWKRVEGPPVVREPKAEDQESLFRRLVRRLVFGLPFPRIKGFSLRESLRLSVVLLKNPTTRDDTLPLAALSVPGLLERHPLPLGFSSADALKLAVELLPRSLLVARIPGDLGRKSPVRTRVVSVAACEDDAYRLRVAASRGRGCRMIFIQHGGEYGFVRTSVAYPMVEYRQHRFMTWGWTRHGDMPGNFLPLPHPQLAAIRGAHRETKPQLLLVGTEMALLPYTLKSMLRGRQFFAYREDKARFLAALDPDMRMRTQYRPYFDVPSSLADATWLLRRFPEVGRCTGPLEPHLFGCRLLVLDHAGTTLGQALAANIPFLLFWRPDPGRFTPEVLPLLDGLREVGILHDTPEAAAEQAARVWSDVPGWWETTRDARKQWADLHALTVKGPVLPLWVRALSEV